MATCQIHKKYRKIECAREPLPDDPDGLCLLHSRREDKDRDGTFTAAIKAKFEQEDYDFAGVFFPGPFSLKELTGQEEFTFAKPVNFSRATFTEKAIFSKASFEKSGTFTWTIFSGEADFAECIFSDVSFFVTIFSDDVNFNGMSIPENKKAHFRGSEFNKQVNFRAIIINGYLILENINLIAEIEKGIRKPWYGDFMRVTVGPKAVVRLRALSLALVKFEGTDLTDFEIDDVNWYLLHGRQTVYEEVLLKRKESNERYHYRIVETIYRQLKANYEKKADHKNAGDFHYGEMEMHRRASIWRDTPFYWYNLYWALSGYGERPLRAMAWLCGLLVCLPLPLLLLGMQTAPGGQVLAGLQGYWQTLVFLLEKSALQRPDWLKPMGTLGRFLSTLSALLLPGQAALFILALRNRLGRRR